MNSAPPTNPRANEATRSLRASSVPRVLRALLPRWGGVPSAIRLAALALAAMLAWHAVAPSARAQDDFEPGPFDREYRELWTRGDVERAHDLLDARINSQRRIHVRWALDRAQMRFELGRVDEAIRDMELVAGQIPEPVYLLRLAEYYRFRGDRNMFRIALDRASRMLEAYRDFGAAPDNAVARARILELRGENPRTILSEVIGPLHEKQPTYWPAFVFAGELALRRNDHAFAAEQFRKALAIEEECAPALAGLAETFRRSGDPRLTETLAALEKINPRHPALKAVRAETYLDERDVAKAERLCDEGLQLNPRDPNLLGLKAAARFVAGDEAGMRAVQRGALEFNATLSDVHRIPGRIAARQYRFREAAEQLRKALELDPEDVEARAELAFALLRLGEETEGREQLEKAFEADKFNVRLFNLLELMDSLEGFASIERGPFRLSIPKREAPVLADEALALLQEAFDRYSKEYDVELETPILVQIFDDHDDFMVRSVGLPGSIGFMGICFGRLITMDSPSARSRWTMNWKNVLWHEFVHVVTLQKTGNRIPRWLSEGISVFEETRKSPAWGQRMEPGYKFLLDREDLPTLSRLESYFTSPKTPEHLMLGYFLAGEFVRSYVASHGFDALKDSLRRIGQGEECLAALVAASGRDAAGVDAEFKAYLETRLAPYKNLPALPEPVAALPGTFEIDAAKAPRPAWAELPSPFTDAMRAGTKALEAKRWDEAEAKLREAHEAFPEYVGGDAPLRLLAKVYEATKNDAALERVLRESLELESRDVPSAMRLLAMAKKRGEWDEVARLAELVLAVDPFDPAPRIEMVEAREKQGRDAEATALLQQLAGLDLAHSLDHRLRRVDALTRMGNWKEARRETLRILEETPHFRDAQDRLLAIHERESEGATRKN